MFHFSGVGGGDAVISSEFRKSLGWGNNNYDYNYVAKGHQRSQMERWGDLFIIYIYISWDPR